MVIAPRVEWKGRLYQVYDRTNGIGSLRPGQRGEGDETGRAAKHTGKGVAKGTKKGVHKAAEGTEKGANKLKDKTK